MDVLRLQSLPPALVSLVCCSLFYDSGFSWTSSLQKIIFLTGQTQKPKQLCHMIGAQRAILNFTLQTNRWPWEGKYFNWKLFLIQKQYYTCTKNKFYRQTMMHFVEEICLNKMEIFLLTHLFSHSSRSMGPCKRTDQINQWQTKGHLKCNMHWMFPLFPENRKSILKFLLKNFSKM